MAICGKSTSLYGPRTISTKESGYGFDMRPGASVDDWLFTNAYAWPKAQKFYGTSSLINDFLPSPITLLPAVLSPLWETEISDSGPYARSPLAEYSIVEGTWEEYPRLHAKDWVIVNKSATGVLKSKKPLPANRGLTVFFRAFGPALNQKTVLSIKFGYNDDSRVFNLNIDADGKGYLSKGSDSFGTLKRLAEGYLVPNRWTSMTADWHKVFILPHGRNRILITSSSGGSFMWQDPSIKREGTGEEIPPLVPTAFFHVTAHQKVAHQVRPIAYVGTPSGADERRVVYGTVAPYDPALYSTARTPNAANQVKNLEWDRFSKVILPEHATVTFTTNALTTMARHSVKPTFRLARPDLAEEHIYHTPFVYRGEVSEGPVRQEAPDQSLDPMIDLIEFNHNQDEKVMTGSVKFKNAHNHGQFKNVFNIPFEWREGANTWIEGVLTKPTHSVKGNQQFVEFDLQDKMRWLENTFVADLNRLDGMAIDDAVKALCKAIGMNPDGSEWDIDEVPSFIDRKTGIKKKTIKLSKGHADDEPTNLTDVVKTVADWLEYIVTTYTSAAVHPFRWVYGFRPYPTENPITHTITWDYKFFFKDPGRFSTTPVKVFWPTTALAILPVLQGGGGATLESAYRSVHQNLQSYLIEPEMNALQVVGMDEMQKPIIVPVQDKRSIDATLAYDDQPANWLGEKRYVAYLDSSLNTKELCTQVAGKLFQRGKKTRQRITFNAQWEPTVRIWDLITVKSYRANGTSLTTHDYRITGFSVDHRADCDEPVPGQYINRPAQYTAEREYDERET